MVMILITSDVEYSIQNIQVMLMVFMTRSRTAVYSRLYKSTEYCTL